MKNICFILLITFTLLSCQSDNNILCDKLKLLLDKFIVEDVKAPIVCMTFKHVVGKELVFFSDAQQYDKRQTDYYFRYKNKIVVVYSTDFRNRDSLFNKDMMEKFNGKIEGYKEKTKYDDGGNDCIEKRQVYQIINRDSITSKLEKIQSCYIARDSSTILSSAINQVVNEYINTHTNTLYLLKFKKIKNRHYFAFLSSYFYDPQNIDGYFYRNNHLITVYNIKESRFLNKQEVKTSPIVDYRSAPMEMDWILNDPICYQINDDGTISKAPNFQTLCEVTINN